MKNKKEIVYGITGSIAAYKAVDVISFLKKLDLNVTCVVTDNALKFIGKPTLETISGARVIDDMFSDNSLYWEVEHISLSERANLIVIAPATANIIAKLAMGLADDFLSTCVLSSKCPVLIVPAMNENMYLNPITQENISKLKKRNFIFMEPVSGRLACGTYGIGKFPEKDAIINQICKILKVVRK
jgi:phosphopantothenoylcysteine decarboxylase / phosphopantothenate---cysteine ligase